jgi:hypothetical protein
VLGQRFGVGAAVGAWVLLEAGTVSVALLVTTAVGAWVAAADGVVLAEDVEPPTDTVTVAVEPQAASDRSRPAAARAQAVRPLRMRPWSTPSQGTDRPPVNKRAELYRSRCAHPPRRRVA